MRWRFYGLLFVLGCSRDRPVTPKPPASTPSVVVVPAPPVAPAADPPVGLVDFTPVVAPAIAANDRGVKLLAGGKIADAQRAFEDALTKAPTFVLARYDLACAKARAGRFAEARADLEQAFEADFIGLRAHAAVDTDLGSFWTSPEGAALTAKLPSYEARYQRVIDRGVRAMLYRGATDGAGRASRRPSVLRVGVFDPATSRFVAVAPRTNHPVVAYPSPNVPYAIVVTGQVATQLGGDLDSGQTLDALQAYRYDTSGTSVGELKLEASAMSSGNLWLKRDGLRIVGYDSMDAGSKPNREWSLDFGHPSVRKNSEKSFAPPADRAVWPDVVNIGYNHWGAYVEQAVRGYAYAKRTLSLPDGKTIEIPTEIAGAAITAIVPAPKGDRVVLVWKDDHLQCSGEPIPGKYRLALVDTRSSVVRSLGAGSGEAAAAFDHDGALYVQKDSALPRLEDEHPLPAGVLLVPPLERDDECGF